MKWKQTDHNDGSVSIRLIPENDDERRELAGSISRWPGGCAHDPDDKARARIDVPLLSKDGTTWPDDLGAGDPKLRDGLFTRRIHIGYKEDGQ